MQPIPFTAILRQSQASMRGSILAMRAAMAPYYRKFHTFHRPPKETGEALGTGCIDDYIQGTSGSIHSSFLDFHSLLGKAWPQTLKNLDFRPRVILCPDRRPAVSGTLPQWTQALGSVAIPVPLTTPLSKTYRIFGCCPNLWYRNYSGEAVREERRGERRDLQSRGGYWNTSAKRQVMVCAAAIQSSQLLELSSIGHHQLTRSNCIEVFVDNRYVGENFKDCPVTGKSFDVIDHLPTMEITRVLK